MDPLPNDPKDPKFDTKLPSDEQPPIDGDSLNEVDPLQAEIPVTDTPAPAVNATPATPRPSGLEADKPDTGPVNPEDIASEVDELNHYDFTPKSEKPVSFRLPKYFIAVFAAAILLMILGGAMYGYSLRETMAKQAEKIRLATQSEAIQAEIRQATSDTESLNTAGEIKNIWMPLIERRPSVAKFLEKLLIVTPSDVKLETIKYELSKSNLARADLSLVLGVVEQTEDGAGYKMQKMRTDLVRYTQYRPDSFNTRYLGNVPITFQGSEAKLIRAEAAWAFTLDRLSESDLTAVYDRLNKTNPVK